MTATDLSNAGKHRSKTAAILSASWLLQLLLLLAAGPTAATGIGAEASVAFSPPSTPCRRRGGRHGAGATVPLPSSQPDVPATCDGLRFKLLAEDDADPTLKPSPGTRSSCDSNNKTRKQRANINKNKNKRRSKRSLATAAASFALLQLGTPPGALFLGGSARMAIASTSNLSNGGARPAAVAVCSSRSPRHSLHARGGHVGRGAAAPVVAAKSADVAGSTSSGGKIGSMKRVALVSGVVAAVSTVYVRKKKKSGASKAGDETEMEGEEDVGEEEEDDDGRATFDSVMGNEDGDDEEDVEAGSSADIDASANPPEDAYAGRSDGSSNIVDSNGASAAGKSAPTNNGSTNNKDGNIVNKSPFSLSRAEKIQKERILNMVADAVATEKEAKSREKAAARERGRAAVAQVGSIESEEGEREDAAAGRTKPTDGKRTVKSDEDFMDDILMETDLAT